MTQWVLVCAIACSAVAQVRTRESDRPKVARIEGKVLTDADLPLRRARIVLRPIEAGRTTIGVEADDKGTFVVRDITPGRYTLVAQRDGYLPTSTCVRGALRMPPIIPIASGQEITNLTFRLRPWAVLSGKVKFDDAEPAIGIRIDAYREFYEKGRGGFVPVSSARTNDRGEYRLHGLQPGNYYVAAVYETGAPAQGYEEQGRVDAEGREVPVLTYATTFFPNTVKLSEAVPVRVDYGQEAAGVDLFLRALRKVKLRGQVTSGVSGQILPSPTIVLQRLDGHNSGTLPSPARAVFDPVGRFEIRDVTPGAYIMSVDATESGLKLTGQAELNIPENDIGNIEVMLEPAQSWTGRIRVEGNGRLDPRKALIVTLEPRNDRAATVTANVRESQFQCLLMGREVYDVYVHNLPDDFYVSAIRVNGTNMMSFGLRGASSPSLEVVLDSRGGKVAGLAAGPDGTVWSGARVMLVPDPAQGRLQDYRESQADEYGQFQVRGVAPGRYIALAWLDDAPCDYYDRYGLDACRSAGTSVVVPAAGQENVMLQMKARR